MKTAFCMIVWGQLEARDNHVTIKQAKDLLELFRNIKAGTFSSQGQKIDKEIYFRQTLHSVHASS
jgi:hypothetical protein